VPRDLRIICPERARKKTNANFPFLQKIEQSQSRLVSQSRKEKFQIYLFILSHEKYGNTLQLCLDITNIPIYRWNTITYTRNRYYRDKEINTMNTKSAVGINTLKAHLAINVRDVEASIEFYKKMFGIEPAKVRTGYAKFDVQNPPLNFTLNQVPFSGGGALSHLGIQVATTDDVVKVRTAWEENGLVAREEMQTTCCYALQDKAWVNDPDGNEWEVFAVLEDNLSEEVQGAADKTCCIPTFTAIDGEKREVTTACC
jgi:catechol 2,3-dioxygenase-like lactoylglutathione lyase family enzyme